MEKGFTADKLVLTQKGTVLNSFIEAPERTFTKVSFIIDNVNYHEDLMIVTL